MRCLQRLISRSYSARLLAIRKVTGNKGRNTAGIDGKLWRTPQQKLAAVRLLTPKGYRSAPLRRIKIPKTKGKWRNLGIPTMRDRAMQALYALTLDPVSETLADLNSYGFRKYRCTHDAIARIFSLSSKQDAPGWVLEADIKGCFDHISHEWLLANIPLERRILKTWLKAGYRENGQLFATKEGTPQGGIISPILANMTLDGLSEAIDGAMGIKTWGKDRRRVNNPYRIHLIRYADDFVVLCDSQEVLINKVKPAIEKFLAERGLSLSKTKTKISRLTNGYDFLGQNVRKYKGKLLIKPSGKSIKSLLDKVKQIARTYIGKPVSLMLYRINATLKGWAMYHRHIVSKAVFHRIDSEVFKILWRWCQRRHRNKRKSWLKAKYFKTIGTYNWNFFVKDSKGKDLVIFKLFPTKIERFVKIRDKANPYSKTDEMYFESRNDYQMLNHYEGRYVLNTLYRRQQGSCPECGEKVTRESSWNIHHILPKYLGGTNKLSNLALLHPHCHQALHARQGGTNTNRQ